MATTELPYLAQGPLAEAFAEQTKDFAFLYDRGTFAAWVGTRWSIGDPENLLLKRAVNNYLGGLFSQYPEPSGKSDYRRVLLEFSIPPRCGGPSQAASARVEACGRV